MNKENNLLFFDIDGTLAVGRTIPEGNRTALKRLKDQGDLTFICTGRCPAYAAGLFEGLIRGIVSCNGRYIQLDGQQLMAWPLTQEEIARIRQIADENGLGVLFAGEEKSWPYHLRNEELESCRRMYGEEGIGQPDSEMPDVYTFDLFYRTPQDFQKACRVFEGFAVLNDHGGHGSADCSTIGQDKGTAVSWLQKYFETPAERVFAFGDGTNDLAMFREAGNRICMENGVEELKRQADYITGTVDQDGIPQALKHYGILK